MRVNGIPVRCIVMSYAKTRTNPKRFRSLVGMDIEHFDALLPYFSEAHDQYFRQRQLGGKPRAGVRQPRIYKNSPLPGIEERLWFICYYLKNNMTQAALAHHFDMEEGNCNLWIHTLYGILCNALREAGYMPASTMKELKAAYRDLSPQILSVLLHDGTEREIPRPSDPRLQQECYSGKKKKHTLKNAVISSFLGAIIFVSATFCGKTHDKRIADSEYFFPSESMVMQDTGYQGYRGDWETAQPVKKTGGKELQQYEKDFNRFVSSKRVRVEHHIGSAKILRIVKDECRVRKEVFRNSVFHVAAAFHNLRLGVKLHV